MDPIIDIFKVFFALIGVVGSIILRVAMIITIAYLIRYIVNFVFKCIEKSYNYIKTKLKPNEKGGVSCNTNPKI